MLRATFGDESSDGVKGRKTLVAGSDGASPALFEMIEEAAPHFARQVEDIETIHWLVPLGGGIGHQKREGTDAVALKVKQEFAAKERAKLEKKPQAAAKPTQKRVA